MTTHASTTTPSVAAALCMASSSTPFAQAVGCELMPIPENFFHQHTELRGRKEAECCEKDPSWKQLLPYAVTMDEDGRIYSYTRGAAGAENRLHGRISIGLGGHVDVAPAAGERLKDVLVSECNRELAEEAGLPSSDIEFLGLICDTTDEVGQVHLGLLAVRIIDAAEKAAMLAEAGIIEKGEFVSLEWLQKPENFTRLENWSQCAVLHLADGN